MTYIILTLFVFGIAKVIRGFFEFYNVDIDQFYDYSRLPSGCGRWDYVSRPRFQRFLLKPTIYCNVCMSSFWGSVAYWGLLNGRDWQEWILHCVICAGVIWIANEIIER